MQSISIYPGLNQNILSALMKKVSSLPDKLCVICKNEMSIKESLHYNKEKDCVEGFEDFGTLRCTKYIANNAFVFMARGLRHKWKQPVGYYLSSGVMPSDTMKSLLLDSIEKLCGVGLQVKIGRASCRERV